MNFMNTNANIKQFQLIRYINENCSDDHVITKITIVLRRDKIEAPYYMTVKIRLSTCLDMPDNGLIHAMDLLNHNRRYNLMEDAYREIESLILDSSKKSTQQAKISKKDEKLKIDFMSKSDDELKTLFENYHELFDKIDNLID